MRGLELNYWRTVLQNDLARTEVLEKRDETIAINVARLKALPVYAPEKNKAREAVYKAISMGILPALKDCFCMDCGGIATMYDHYLGYAPEHFISVQPICSKCDGKRRSATGRVSHVRHKRK